MCSAAAAVLSKAKEKVLQVVSVSYSKHFWLKCCINRRMWQLIGDCFLVESLKKAERICPLLQSFCCHYCQWFSGSHNNAHTLTHSWTSYPWRLRRSVDGKDQRWEGTPLPTPSPWLLTKGWDKEEEEEEEVQIRVELPNQSTAWCRSGVVARDMARQLHTQGLHTPPPDRGASGISPWTDLLRRKVARNRK